MSAVFRHDLCLLPKKRGQISPSAKATQIQRDHGVYTFENKVNAARISAVFRHRKGTVINMAEKIKIILASASPRRHELLSCAGIPHEIIITDADETLRGTCHDCENYAEWFARSVSLLKADAASSEVKPEHGVRTLIVCADTVVSPDFPPNTPRIFGKPKDEDDARRMLKTLSGSEHSVVGGITVSEVFEDAPPHTVSRSYVTRVSMKSLSDSVIDSYIETGEPFGKAGAYAIQGKASMFVCGITGDYANVVGISVSGLCDIFKEEFSLPAESILKLNAD